MEQLVVVLVLTVVGFITGTLIERSHFKSIEEREKKLLKVPLTTVKKPLGELSGRVRMVLVSGSVVISVDYFKVLAAGIKNIFGGRLTTYESLLDRARREAVLRMIESQPKAKQICNVRIETASISKDPSKSVGSVEVLAYGTALVPA